MKTLALLVFGFFLSLDSVAQVYDMSTVGQDIPCVLVLKSGETKDVIATHQHPDFLKKQYSQLLTATGPVSKETLEAFSMNGKTWVFRSTPLGPMWVMLKKQGAIEHYDYLTSDSDGKTSTIIIGNLTMKGSQTLSNADLLLGYKKKMSSMVSDYPELAAKITNGEKGYGMLTMLNVVDEYNLWYEKNNPGKIKYLSGFGPGSMKSASDNKSFSEMREEAQERKDSIRKVREERIASRPASPAADIASKKANLPPKKETFTAKLKRFEAEGHKVAVVVESQIVKVNLPQQGCVEGKAQTEFSNPEANVAIAAKLNSAFQTTLFEPVSMDRIPLTQNASNMDDWWSTHYKVVVFINDIQSYDVMLNTMDNNYETTFRLNTIATVVEYVDDSKKSRDYLKRLFNLGSGYSSAVKYKTSDCPMTLEKLVALVPTEKCKETYEKNQQDQLAKIVSKWD